MTKFDPEAFMQQTVDGALETEFKLIPINEYRAFIDDFDSTAFTNFDFEYKQGPKAGQPGSMQKFSIPFAIDDGGAAAALVGRERAVVYMEVTLDIDPTTGGLDKGVNKNVKLGQVRAAVGQNDQDKPWQFAMLKGQGPVMIKVVHTPFERKDKTKGTRVEVERVSRIS